MATEENQTADAPLAKEASGAVAVQSTKPTVAEATMTTVLAYLKTYAEKMSPKAAIEAADGVGYQKSLLTHLKKVLRLEGTDFDNGWSAVLAWVNENVTGVMGPRYRYRFLDQAVTMAKSDREMLERLLHLLTATADGAVIQAVVSRYDFNRIYKVLPGDQAQKIEGFYSQYGAH